MLPGEGSILFCSPTLGPTVPRGGLSLLPRGDTAAATARCCRLRLATGRVSPTGAQWRDESAGSDRTRAAARVLNRLNRTQLDSTSQSARSRLPGALAGSEWTPLDPPAGQTKVAPSVSPSRSRIPPPRRFFADWAQKEWSLTRRLNADFWLHHVAFRQRQRISLSVTRRPLN